MKKTIQALTALALALLCLVCLFSCKKNTSDPWKNAIYTEDTTLGTGKTTVTVEVVVGKNSIAITLKTDKDTLANAMKEHGLIEGEQGEYGLYVKKVNGITADYDKDQRYWALYVDGEYAMTGADGTEIKENAVYKFEYAK